MLFSLPTCVWGESGEGAKKKEVQKNESKPEKKEEKKEEGHGGAPDSRFVTFDNMLIPVIQKREVKGFVSMTIALDGKDPENVKANVSPYKEMLKDRIFWDMYATFGIIWEPDFQVDLKSLKKRLLAIVKDTLKRDDVQEVLIEDYRQDARIEGNNS
jgi:hypothetical protein